MSRLFVVLGLAFAALATLIGAVAMLAYGGEPSRRGSLEVPGLDAEARLSWTETGQPSIDADSESAFWTGLGYAHAADHGWAIALWRQAALGSLSTWVGSEASEADRHARQLGFGPLARQAYRDLDATDRAAVDAYSRGIALAFADPAVAERDEFIRLGVEAALWEPWHALAIERMVAWLGTTPVQSDSTSEPLVEFAQSDSLFRSTLALGGLEHARAYLASTSAGPTLVQHQPYGASALPLLVGVRTALSGRQRLLATVPGTLILAGASGEWAVFLTSASSVSRDSSAAPPPQYSRLVDRDGDETLIRVYRDRVGLQIQARAEAPRDTLAVDASGEPVLETPSLDDAGIRLRWTGFEPVTDVAAFRALLTDAAPSFRLFDGDGIEVQNDTPSVLGAPVVAVQDSGWILVGAHPTAELAASRMEALARQRPAVSARRWALDEGSPWALARTQRLVRALGNRDSLDFALQSSYAFLRGWDGLYTPDAVAPSIAEAWILRHRDLLAHEPLTPPSELDSLMLTRTLHLGMAWLQDSLGTQPGAWRWNRVTSELRYPVLGDTRGRYSSVASASGGHVSAPRPGPSLILDGPPGPALFTMWSGRDEALTQRPTISRGVPRDGRAPLVIRRWSSDLDSPSVLRLVPVR